ncbi:nucleotide exchange factor GrpE [Buchnera aphidicola]|uniref:Hsp70 co-chaperone n=1 Tax=Buchnera aphidicola subsp. Cinara cedri (strain Cc) TaxID=372461 RepID=Q057V3_BUCCC|nr:nucleotide exchange factor GrpE [Buchnera aphidicola]ABJ90596.1 Hsp70 co-chaperone [Buchnera aphidicola BCc]
MIEKNEKKKILKKDKKKKITIKKIEKKISLLIKEKKNIRLRHYANIENIIKKNASEIKFIKTNMFENFLNSIFSIINKIDLLTINLKNMSSTQKSLFEGIKLTKNIFEKNLKNWKIKKINKINIPFNEKIHKIKKNEKKNSISKNKKIKNIIKPGYILKNKVIKKAIVLL